MRPGITTEILTIQRSHLHSFINIRNGLSSPELSIQSQWSWQPLIMNASVYWEAEHNCFKYKNVDVVIRNSNLHPPDEAKANDCTVPAFVNLSISSRWIIHFLTPKLLYSPLHIKWLQLYSQHLCWNVNVSINTLVNMLTIAPDTNTAACCRIAHKKSSCRS